MRRHAWNIFAGLTFNTASGVPVFRTWYTKLDLFPGLDASRAEALGGFGFEFPRQFLPLKASGSTANTNVAGTMPVLDKVYYNQTLYEFAVKAQLNCGSVKTDLNKGFDPHNGVGGAQIEDRHIAAFPRDSIAIKTAWWAVAANALTPLPVWDPESNSMADGGNASNGRDGAAWSRYVAVDSRGGGSHAGGVIQALAGGVLQTMRVVSLRRFHWIQITTKEELDEVRALLQPGAPDQLSIGGYVVLVGLHFTTKEVPEWVWGTFWWHDEPDRGPFAAQRPGVVTGLWQNYLMNVAYSMNDPREIDGSPHISFNPYLEAQQPGGMHANCMTCHRLATWLPLDPKPKEARDMPRGEISPGDARFTGRLKLDFLWTLSDSGDPKTCPAKDAGK